MIKHCYASRATAVWTARVPPSSGASVREMRKKQAQHVHLTAATA
jgi:hypothetical protein